MVILLLHYLFNRESVVEYSLRAYGVIVATVIYLFIYIQFRHVKGC